MQNPNLGAYLAQFGLKAQQVGDDYRIHPDTPWRPELGAAPTDATVSAWWESHGLALRDAAGEQAEALASARNLDRSRASVAERLAAIELRLASLEQ